MLGEISMLGCSWATKLVHKSLIAHLATNSRTLVPQQQMRSVSGPQGEKYGWQQLAEAFQAAHQGKDVAYQGAWGQIGWDVNGDPTSAVYVVWQHKDSKTTNLKTFTFGK